MSAPEIQQPTPVTKPSRLRFNTALYTLVPLVMALSSIGIILSRSQSADNTLLAAVTRTKGDTNFRVFREVGGVGREASSGEAFRVGERLRFVVDLPVERQVQVIGREEDGRLFPVWPLDGTTVRLPPGPSQELAGAIALDGALGSETFYLVTCEIGVEKPACVSRGSFDPPDCEAGCAMEAFVLLKR